MTKLTSLSERMYFFVMASIVIGICCLGILAFWFFLEEPRQNSIDDIRNMSCDELWDRIIMQQETTGQIGDYTLSSWIARECFS